MCLVVSKKNILVDIHICELVFHSIPLDMAQQHTAKQRLIYGILRFLDGEIRAEAANAERRESMEGK
jgi:hypothetical protein